MHRRDSSFSDGEGAGCPFDPPPGVLSLQASALLARARLWDGSTPWLVTGHAEQRALLGDTRISHDIRRQAIRVRARRPRAREGVADLHRHGRPEHARLRAIVTAEFAIKRIEARRPVFPAGAPGASQDERRIVLLCVATRRPLTAR